MYIQICMYAIYICVINVYTNDRLLQIVVFCHLWLFTICVACFCAMEFLCLFCNNVRLCALCCVCLCAVWRSTSTSTAIFRFVFYSLAVNFAAKLFSQIFPGKELIFSFLISERVFWVLNPFLFVLSRSTAFLSHTKHFVSFEKVLFTVKSLVADWYLRIWGFWTFWRWFFCFSCALFWNSLTASGRRIAVVCLF